MNKALQIEVRPFEHGSILHMQGHLTKQAEEAIRPLYQKEPDNSEKRNYLLLDFTDVPYINSAGIALLIRLVRSRLKGNVHSFAYGLSPHYQKLFRMIGLSDYLVIYPDEYTVMARVEELAARQ